MASNTVTEDSHSIHISHSIDSHDAYGDKLLWLPGLSVLFFGLAIYNLFKQEVTFIVLFALLFLVSVMAYFYYRSTKPAHPDFVPERNLQMWGFLASEVIFFTAIIGLSQLIKIKEVIIGGYWGKQGEFLNIPVTALNTFILICSSLTMVLAQDAISKDDQKKLRIYLLATFIIGATFLSIQIFEYSQLFQEGFGPDHSLYAATFYLQTGFHGFHVSIGLVALLGVLLATFKGKFTKDNHMGVELMGLYWHFIDLVWLFLFAIVYLI